MYDRFRRTSFVVFVGLGSLQITDTASARDIEPSARTSMQACIARFKNIVSNRAPLIESRAPNSPQMQEPPKPLAFVEDNFPSTQPAAVRVDPNAASMPAPVRPFAPAPSPSIEGMAVKEWHEAPASPDVIGVSAEEYVAMHGQPDLSKVKKVWEPPTRPRTTPKSDTWHRSLIDVGDGNSMTVVYRIIEKKRSGKVVIQFENPFHRGQVETREFTPAELRRGYKELAEPPKKGEGLF